jgi:stage III sporulation protein AE
LGERFLEFFSGQVFSVFQKGRKNLARLLLITVAAAFFSNFTSIFQNRQTAEAGFYILYLVVIAICLEAYQSMNLYAEEKTGELVQLMQVFCPSFFLAVAFTGKSSSALMFYNTILFLIYLVELLVLHFLLPAVKVLSCLTGEDLFSEFAELLEKCIQWSLKSMIAAVSGISLIRGFLNPAIDSLKMTAAGRTLEAVPWIGDVAGGTMDVALGVAVLLKNGIGVAGMIFIAVLALIPLVEFLILAFLYQLVAALVQPVSDRRITTCISGVSSGYQLMVKVIASTTLLFVLSIALVVAVTS